MAKQTETEKTWLDYLLTQEKAEMSHKFEGSSLLKEAKYDKASKTLVVKFLTSKDVYLFYDVPLKVVEAFIEAKSAGKFFTNTLKGRYAFSKLTAKKPPSKK